MQIDCKCSIYVARFSYKYFYVSRMCSICVLLQLLSKGYTNTYFNMGFYYTPNGVLLYTHLNKKCTTDVYLPLSKFSIGYNIWCVDIHSEIWDTVFLQNNLSANFWKIYKWLILVSEIVKNKFFTHNRKISQKMKILAWKSSFDRITWFLLFNPDLFFIWSQGDSLLFVNLWLLFWTPSEFCENCGRSECNKIN